MEDEIIEKILSCRKSSCVKNDILESYMFSSEKDMSKLRILILNAPCNGFGDLIFAKKLAGYMRDIYAMTAVIATTLYDSLITLGEKEKNCIKLVSKNTKKRKYSMQCRRFKYLKFDTEPTKKWDLIFIAPVSADQTPDLSDVQHLVPSANFLNTFTFSEYNDKLSKQFDFNTGVGDNREGLFFTDVTRIRGQYKLKNKPPLSNYSIAYILDPEKSAGASSEKCLLAFFNYMSNKYKEEDLEVVVAPWINRDIDYMKKKIMNAVLDRKIFMINNKGEKIVLRDKGEEHTFIIRADVLPVANDDMIRLIKYSMEDILVTGDQSITDVLSTGHEKIIFYQIVPWKKNFSKELARLLPDVTFNSTKTSCGTIKSVTYSSQHVKFVAQWDFKTITRKKFEAIFTFANQIKHGRMKKLYKNIISCSRLSKLKKIIMDEN